MRVLKTAGPAFNEGAGGGITRPAGGGLGLRLTHLLPNDDQELFLDTEGKSSSGKPPVLQPKQS